MDTKTSLIKIRTLLLDQCREVQNGIGGVIGYTIDLDLETTRRAFQIIEGVDIDDLHNHRCDIDHPPCPACELIEEREHEREAGL